MVLDLGTLYQFNKLKATYFVQQFANNSVVNFGEGVVSPVQPFDETNAIPHVADCCIVDSSLDEVIEIVYLPIEDKMSQSKKMKTRPRTVADCCVVDSSLEEEIEVVLYSSTPTTSYMSNASHKTDARQTVTSRFLDDLVAGGCIMCSDQDMTTPWSQELESASRLLKDDLFVSANGPVTPTIINDDDALEYGKLGFFDEPCAFMNFIADKREKKPVIFDTGASLAITHDKSDFDGPLTVPKEDLRLGRMANGLKIEGVGPVIWMFANGEGDDVSVRGMAYYVPQAKARLLSPQHLFDSNTEMRGRYEGDHKAFRLHLEGSPPLTIEYDDRNSLPIGYASFGADIPHAHS